MISHYARVAAQFRSGNDLYRASSRITCCRKSIWPQPLDLVDPKSHMIYFQAAQQFAKSRRRETAYRRAIQPIPYWQDLFPAAAGAGLLSGNEQGPLRVRRKALIRRTHLRRLLKICTTNTIVSRATKLPRRRSRTYSAIPPARARGGTYYGPARRTSTIRTSFLRSMAWQTRSNSNYNALQVTLRHAMSAGLPVRFELRLFQIH